LDIGFIDSSGAGVDYPFESGAHYIHLDKRFYFQRQDPPCEFVAISEELCLGTTCNPNENEELCLGTTCNPNENDKFEVLLQDPTFLNYAFYNIADVLAGTQNLNLNDVVDLSSYNGQTQIILEVTLADYMGEYELGKRDIAGGCIDLSALKQSDLGDDC
jgi:hypothetical protein